MESLESATIYTTGWIVKETDKELLIVSSLAILNEDIDFAHDTIIPKGVVENIKVLRKAWWR